MFEQERQRGEPVLLHAVWQGFQRGDSNISVNLCLDIIQSMFRYKKPINVLNVITSWTQISANHF